MISDAVILAAGTGSRLGESEDDLPKPLYVVGGTPLIKRVITNLASAGVKRIVVVTGFMASRIREALETDVRVELVHNPDFEKSNGISVILGGRHVGGPFLLSMADHVYRPAIAQLVAASDLDAADLYLATDPRIETVLDLDDATKVRSEGGRIVEIGKSLATYDRIDCGVFAVTQRLVHELEQLRGESGDCALTDGVRVLAERGRARLVDIGDEPWHDVDTPADRVRAEHRLGLVSRD